MNQAQQKLKAKEFVQRWQAAEGNEQREANSFWIELCHDLLGMPNPTHDLDFERKVQGKRIDIFYEDMGILIENKSRGVDLDALEQRGKHRDGSPRMVTPYTQAKWYADNLPRSVSPRWVITCNFDEIRIYDLEKESPEKDYETIRLEELPGLLHRLDFFTKKEGSRLEREKELSIQAGQIVGKLYDALSKRYLNIETDPEEQRSLNVLVVRLVFLLYAEDAGLLQEHQAFYRYLQPVKLERMRTALADLFRVLDTPEDERDPYDDPTALAFPYVNGGLFHGQIIIPQFDLEARVELLQQASAGFDWSDISPTIFGAVFESTLNPETRRAGGMHYTSIENIHKVTGPLFYDALVDELRQIEGLKTVRSRKQRLRAFQLKLSRLKFLDPACGSGNFLTETYVSLRKLELRVIEDIVNAEGEDEGQTSLGMTVENAIMVSIDQFYGIEINGFAVSVAKTALWIAEEQMLERTQELLPFQEFDFLPLKSNGNIVEGNALRMDWNNVLPAEGCDYVMGNPPFVGKKEQNAQQKRELIDSFCGLKVGNLDYVASWYAKASDYIESKTKCAFVSTNSIAQGEQPSLLWPYLSKRDVQYVFAWRPFVWNNEAPNQAHVHVVIIGFSKGNVNDGRVIFDANGNSTGAININPYLLDAPNVVITSRTSPISDVPQLHYGSMPIDGGFLIVNDELRKELLEENPANCKYIREYMGGNELINGKRRWCLWLTSMHDVDESSLIQERVRLCRDYRLNSNRPQTKKAAEKPFEFGEIRQPDTQMLVIPKVSSHRRQFIPVGFIGPSTIVNGSALILPKATLYEFGIISSSYHNGWMRSVAGRMKSDYQYSANIVYNNFVWPSPTPDQREAIERTAQGILDARAAHPDATLADLYDPDEMPADLRAAHEANDAAVEAAYGIDFGGDEERIVAHLFKLYAEATEGENDRQ